MDEPQAVWAYALYTPHGRVSDWFPLAPLAPQPRAWGHYKTRELEVLRQYIGDMTDREARHVFEAASRNLGYESCRTSEQAVLRDEILAPRILDMLADCPAMGPAE